MISLYEVLFFRSPTQYSSLHLTWKEKLRQLDLPGVFVLIPAIVGLILALQWGGSTYAWSDPKVIVLLVIVIVLIVIFAVIQWWQQDNATVPPRVFLQT